MAIADIKKKKFNTLLTPEIGAPNQRDYDNTMDYKAAVKDYEIATGKVAPKAKTLADVQAKVAADEASRIADEAAALADPAKAILGADAELADPLEIPGSAELERARRRAVIKASMRQGRASTIMSDKSY